MDYSYNVFLLPYVRELLRVQTQLDKNAKLEYDERRNKYKKQMIQNINESFDNLERTLKSFKY
jgi:hypothetical protein